MIQLIKYMFVFLFLLNSTAILQAQDTFQEDLFSTDSVLKYRSELDLSETQVGAIKKNHSDHITQFNSLKWDLDAAHVALKKLLAESQVDEEASLASMEKILSIERQIKKIRLGMLIKVKNLLSKTQQEKLKTLRTKSDINGTSFVTSITKNPRISIKGTAGSGGEEPLFVVYNSRGELQRGKNINFKSINPNDIESVTILKGQAAKTQYGKEGVNGVVIINLKNL